MPAQPVLLPCSASLVTASGQHHRQAPSLWHFPCSTAPWVNDCHIFILLELQKQLLSVVILPMERVQGAGSAADNGRTARPRWCERMDIACSKRARSSGLAVAPRSFPDHASSAGHGAAFYLGYGWLHFVPPVPGQQAESVPSQRTTWGRSALQACGSKLPCPPCLPPLQGGFHCLRLNQQLLLRSGRRKVGPARVQPYL